MDLIYIALSLALFGLAVGLAVVSHNLESKSWCSFTGWAAWLRRACLSTLFTPCCVLRSS